MAVATASGFILLTLVTIAGIIGGFKGVKLPLILSQTNSKERTSYFINQLNASIQPVRGIAQWLLVGPVFFDLTFDRFLINVIFSFT
jgi:hypothetical protein